MWSIPKPGRYRRKADGVAVEVVGCTGNTSFADTVAVQGTRLSHVRLENFWKKYEPIPDGAAVTEPEDS